MKLETNSKIDQHKLFVKKRFACKHVAYLKGDQSVAMANADILYDYQA